MGILLTMDRHRRRPRRDVDARLRGPAEILFFTGIRYERGGPAVVPDRIDLAARLPEPDRDPRGAGRRRRRRA